MLLKNSVRWVIVLTFLGLLLASPKPALAGADCGSDNQNGANCCGTQYGSNCYGDNQNGSNCFTFQGGTMCYYGQQSGNPAPSYVAPTYGNSYPNYAAPTGGTYVVQWGDTMRIIADRLGISLTSLIAANPQIWNPDVIYGGQVLNLPGYNTQASYYPQQQDYGQYNYYPQPQNYGQYNYYPQPQNYGPPTYYHPRNSDDYFRDYYRHHPSNLYTVQPGDTLKSIAKAYNTSVDDLLKLNPSLHGVPGRIHVGLVLVVW